MMASRVKASAAILLLLAGGLAGRGVVRATDPACPQAAGEVEGPTPREALLKLEKAGYEALKGTDRVASFALLAPDFVAVVAGEGRMDRAEFLKVLARVTVTEYSLSDVTLVQLTPDAATLTYRAKTSFTYDGKPAREALWVSSTWAKRGGTWTNVFYQETRDD